jgi:hypothetical protein
MKNKLLLQFAQKMWRSYGGYLPERARRRVIEVNMNRMKRQFRFEEDEWSSGLDDLVFDSQLAENLEQNRNQRTAGLDDGMRDYPSTRPQLTFEYLSGLVHWLADSEYRVISYNDLAFIPDYGHEQKEFQHWIVDATERGEKAILLQYDVDARADVTIELMKKHIDLGVPANAMIFREKIFDWKLKREGIVEVDPDYHVDFEVFEQFQKAGGVVGYHCNAFDRSGGDMDRAIEIFHQDVAELRKYVDLKFFSMHGGHMTADGKCNARIEIYPYLKDLGMTWVHNGHSVYFHSNWADGSASNPGYRSECNNPLDFILSTGNGQRTRLLFHPQYYNDFSNRYFDFPIIQDQKWVMETRNEVERGAFAGKQYWQRRMEDARASIREYDQLFIEEQVERPVFINGMSRSGTTLLASLFDAHPKGAMAYESYPRYLYAASDDGILYPEEFTYTYQVLINYPEKIAFQLLNRAPLRNLMRFVAVTGWTGMTTSETGELLRAYLSKHHRISEFSEAMKVVAATARYKLRRQCAAFWGTKCQGNFEDYFSMWPEARLIYIMRNGLDILASQKTNGSFDPDPRSLGRSWKSQHDNFMRFKETNPGLSACLVNYESLVEAPEKTMRSVCREIGLKFDSQMLRQHEQESTLTANPRGQLSAKRVQQPIDNKSVNRWKKILVQEDVDLFLEGCSGTSLFKKYRLDWEL